MLLDVEVNGSGAAILESFCGTSQLVDGFGVYDGTCRFAFFADHDCRGSQWG